MMRVEELTAGKEGADRALEEARRAKDDKQREVRASGCAVGKGAAVGKRGGVSAAALCDCVT